MSLIRKLKEYWSSPSPRYLQKIANNLFPIICYLLAFAISGFLLFLIPYLTRASPSPLWGLDTSTFATIRSLVGGVLGVILFHRWYLNASSNTPDNQ